MGIVRAWMEASGWTLVDYAEEEGSAAFDRPADAPALPWWHATRWLRGPGLPSLSAAFIVSAVLLLVVLATATGGTLMLRSQDWFSRLIGSGDVQEEQGDWRMILADYLNLRTGPGTENPVVEVLRQGDRVRIVNHQGKWVELSHPAQGWVDEAFLSNP